MRSLWSTLALVAACSSSSSTTADGPLGSTDGPVTNGDGPRPDAPKIVDAPPGGTPDAPTGTSPDAPPYPTVNLVPTMIASGLSQPLAIMMPPGETRFFAAEKTGTISIIENGTPRTPAFIDIHTNLSMHNYDEEGLLSLVFHPHFDTNGRVFVYFTGRMTGSQESDQNIHIWEFHAAADHNSATFTKEIIDIPHTTAMNHNGGKMIFGPADGMLYISVGDGGGGFGSESDTRSVTTRLGKILRIDVDNGNPYQSPPDNPFASMASAEAKDVWFWGLRNPWRWSFDRQTHDFWIGDVGQNCFEEIDFIPAGTKGSDLGWNAVEGINHKPVQTCSQVTSFTQPGAVVPVSEYDHSHGNAVVGGYVYRGANIPEIQGMYFFSDNGSGFIRSFWANFPVPFNQTKSWQDLTEPAVSTFDEDPNGELLYCSILLSPNGKCHMVTRKP